MEQSIGRRLAQLGGLLVLFCIGIGGAIGQETDGSQPILLDAAEIQYDEALGLVTASGDVELSQGDRVLRADSISFNQRTNTATASGNVTLLEPTGEVLFAEYAELTDNLREGFLRGLNMLLSDDSRVAAVNAQRRGGVETQLSQAVYSPCQECVTDDGVPLWQVKARTVTHNSEEKVVVYRDARLEMAGVPILYTPYLSHPDPTVKRKSGLLTPTFGASEVLGAAIQIPYFWAINDSSDMLFDPIFASDQLPIMTGQYRHALSSGELRARGSSTRDDAQTGEDRWRGHFDGDARFTIDDTWRWGSDIFFSSDDTYLKRYGFGSTDTLTSQVFAEGFTTNNYAQAEVQFYQGLRAEDEQDLIPIVAPNLNYNFVGEPNRFGAFLTMDANVLALTRTDDDATGSRRLALLTGWELPHIGSAGDVTTLRITLQTDLYNVSNVPEEDASGTFSGFTGRVFPKVSLDWRYPMVRNSGRSSQFFEPLVTLVASPNGSNPDKIPNEDSLAFELEETNIFERSRFTGTDRVDGGSWTAYGLRAGAAGLGGGSTTFLLGQSYRLRSDNTYPVNSGLDGHFSDFVGRVIVSPNEYFDLLYKTRLDKKNLDSKRTEIGASAGPRAFRASAEYVFFDSTEEISNDREELFLSASSDLTNRWKIAANTRRDLTKDGNTLSYGGSLTYNCECMTFELTYSRTFTRDRDVRPDEAIFVRLNLKSLGEVESKVY